MALVSVVALALAACGGDDDITASDPTEVESTEPAPDETDAAAPDTTSTDTEAPAGEDNAEWEAVVAAATEEGSVTVFSNQLPGQLETFEAAFEEAYPGIDMVVVRGLITENQPRIEAERASGQDTADFIVSFDKPWVIQNSEAGWWVPPTGPAFSSPDFDSEQYLHHDWFHVTSSIVPITWNTDLYPEGIETYEDLLNPALAGGNIGIPDVQSGLPMVDFYVFLEDLYGPEFVVQLAAQDPIIYAGTGPIMAAVAAGEVAVSLWGVPPIADQEAGAPLDFVVPDEAFGSRGFGAVYEAAPNPNAAQVAADFMMSAAGQQTVSEYWASPLPNIPGSLADLSTMRDLDLDRLTPEYIEEVRATWENLFR